MNYLNKAKIGNNKQSFWNNKQSFWNNTKRLSEVVSLPLINIFIPIITL